RSCDVSGSVAYRSALQGGLQQGVQVRPLWGIAALAAPDDDDDLSLGRVFGGILVREGAEGAASHLFEQFRQFAGDRRWSVAEHRREVSETVGETARALEQDECRRYVGEFADRLAAGGQARWQKAGEHEAVARQARELQRRQNGGWTRNGRHFQPGGDGFFDQLIARIGNERRPRVGYERDRLAATETLQDGGPRLCGVVLVIGNQSVPDAVPGEETAGEPRVLAGDHVCAAQGLDRTKGQ